MNKNWWKESVVYQIYPRSFKDTTGNGIGDIRGIISKLDYIKSLGVDVIWLCPVYDSPNFDNGYDIRDYKKISPEFGSEEDFDELLDEMHQKGLKLVMDLVANHTSFEHYWFKESQKSKENPYRDYYIWREGEKNKAPNNWQSFFGGNAWTYDENTNSYYLHLFTKEQPDLNWENPKVRKEIYDVMHYWFQKGVDGFRMDVISVISKPDGLPDSKLDDFQETIKQVYANGPKLHEYLNEMNKEVLSKYDVMTVGEGPGIDLSNGLDYVHRDRQELNMVFHFDHMFMEAGPEGKYDIVPFDFIKFKEVFGDWDVKLSEKGWGSIFLGNHDFARMISRFGNDNIYQEESAKLLSMLLLTLRGTVYIYQGDEIGMTNVLYGSIEEYNDVETLNAWTDAKNAGKNMNDFFKNIQKQSRDNARTPMQWDNSKDAGFTNGVPWLKVNSNFEKINIKKQIDKKDSVLNFYRSMIILRKEFETLVYGNYKCLDLSNKSVFAYERWDTKNRFLIVLNFSDQEYDWIYEMDFENYNLMKSNYLDSSNDLVFKPWEAKLFKKSKN